MKKLLIACTADVPFTDHHGNLYRQVDGVCMGSALGPIFANFYMTQLENNLLESDLKPKLYVRYVDDILILTDSNNNVLELKKAFENNSVLSFSCEFSKDNKLPFLDVLVDVHPNNFVTSPYKKPSSKNSPLLNFVSECPERYKVAVIKNLIYRAKSISSCSSIFHKALCGIKQTLINNGYPNHIVDRQISITLENSRNNNETNNEIITLFYGSQFHQNYKVEEKSMKNIIKQNISPVDTNKKIKFIIYYRKFKTANLLLHNNPSKNKNKVAMTHLVYEFSCPLGICNSHINNSTYIGHTTTSLSRRLTCHKTNKSSIIKHLDTHSTSKNLHRKILVENTRILHIDHDVRRLQIAEALLIKEKNPSINRINFAQGDNVLRVYNN